jgi:hypothetical protein
MRVPSFIALALAALPATSVLAGCDNAGSQSQFVLSQAHKQSAGPDSMHPATGKKKSGPYWWVWVSATVPAGATHSFFAYCPKNYVVTGGGYSEGAPGPWNVNVTAPHLPDLTYWMLIVSNNNFSSSGRMTEYAVCAPTSSSGMPST